MRESASKTFPEMTYAERDRYLADWLERQHDELLDEDSPLKCDHCGAQARSWDVLWHLCDDCYYDPA